MQASSLISQYRLAAIADLNSDGISGHVAEKLLSTTTPAPVIQFHYFIWNELKRLGRDIQTACAEPSPGMMQPPPAPEPKAQRVWGRAKPKPRGLAEHPPGFKHCKHSAKGAKGKQEFYVCPYCDQSFGKQGKGSCKTHLRKQHFSHYKCLSCDFTAEIRDKQSADEHARLQENCIVELCRYSGLFQSPFGDNPRTFNNLDDFLNDLVKDCSECKELTQRQQFNHLLRQPKVERLLQDVGVEGGFWTDEEKANNEWRELRWRSEDIKSGTAKLIQGFANDDDLRDWLESLLKASKPRKRRGGTSSIGSATPERTRTPSRSIVKAPSVGDNEFTSASSAKQTTKPASLAPLAPPVAPVPPARASKRSRTEDAGLESSKFPRTSDTSSQSDAAGAGGQASEGYFTSSINDGTSAFLDPLSIGGYGFDYHSNLLSLNNDAQFGYPDPHMQQGLEHTNPTITSIHPSSQVSTTYPIYYDDSARAQYNAPPQHFTPHSDGHQSLHSTEISPNLFLNGNEYMPALAAHSTGTAEPPLPIDGVDQPTAESLDHMHSVSERTPDAGRAENESECGSREDSDDEFDDESDDNEIDPDGAIDGFDDWSFDAAIDDILDPLGSSGVSA